MKHIVNGYRSSHWLLREDYTQYRTFPNGVQTSYVIHAGQYKTRPNSVITRYGDRFEYASPEETPALMTDLIDWYNEEEQKGELTPVELAAIFHYRYIRIHPFEDGNGRIARLMRDNPDITYAQLTTDLGINTSAVQKLVKRMTNNGYITRLENVSWRVIATSIV